MGKKQIIPESMRLPLLSALTFNTAVYYGARALTADREHYDLSIGPDGWIPFLPWTIVIYWGCYLFWLVNYIIGCRQDQEKAFRFISADFFAKAVCLLFFLILPTTNTRPVMEGASIWEEGMRLLYRVDAADNLFPSIHCLTSWFCHIAVRENSKVSKGYKMLSLMTALSICISTLTTRQHVIADVIGGIALSEVSYLFVEKSGFYKRYGEIMIKTAERIKRRRPVE